MSGQHAVELFPVEGGKWAWLCTCGEDRADYETSSDAELDALAHE